MERAERGVGIGVLGPQTDGGVERRLDAHAKTQLQGLRDADALGVAAERIGEQEVGVGVARILLDLGLGPRDHLEEQRETLALAALEVVRLHGLRLVGHRHAVR